MQLLDDYLYFDTSNIRGVSENDKLIMYKLFQRQFFYRLEKKLNSIGCENELSISTSILQAMGFGKKRIDETLILLRNAGGYCDCEVIYNIYIPCIQNEFNDEYI